MSKKTPTLTPEQQAKADQLLLTRYPNAAMLWCTTDGSIFMAEQRRIAQRHAQRMGSELVRYDNPGEEALRKRAVAKPPATKTE